MPPFVFRMLVVPPSALLAGAMTGRDVPAEQLRMRRPDAL